MPVPTASFDWALVPGTYGVTVEDTSQHKPTEWAWDWGDGSAEGAAQNAAHYYAAAGTYTITLTATNDDGSDVATAEVDVPELVPTAAFSYSFVPGTRWLVFVNESVHSGSYVWTFGDGDTSTELSPAHEYAADGDYTVTLEATGTGGIDTFERIVRVALTPAPEPRPDDLNIGVDIEVDGEWQSLYCAVQSAAWTYGGNADNGPYGLVTSGSLALVVQDVDRLLDPTNRESPYFGQWDIGTRLRVSIGGTSLDGTPWQAPCWVGTCSDITSNMRQTTLRGNDGVAMLNRTEVDTGGDLALPQQTTGERMNALLDAAGWPAHSRDIASGGHVLQALSFDGQTTWDALNYVNQSELGRMALTQDGRPYWRNRSAAWAIGLPRLTVGCDGDTGIHALTLGGSTAAMATYIKAGIIGGLIKTYAADQRYGRFDASATDLQLLTDGDTDDWAAHLLAHVAEPLWNVERLQFFLSPDIAPSVLRAVVGDLWRVTDDGSYTGGPELSMTGRFVGMAVTVSAFLVTVTAYITQDAGLPCSGPSAFLDNYIREVADGWGNDWTEDHAEGEAWVERGEGIIDLPGPSLTESMTHAIPSLRSMVVSQVFSIDTLVTGEAPENRLQLRLAGGGGGIELVMTIAAGSNEVYARAAHIGGGSVIDNQPTGAIALPGQQLSASLRYDLQTGATHAAVGSWTADGVDATPVQPLLELRDLYRTQATTNATTFRIEQVGVIDMDPEGYVAWIDYFDRVEADGLGGAWYNEVAATEWSTDGTAAVWTPALTAPALDSARADHDLPVAGAPVELLWVTEADEAPTGGVGASIQTFIYLQSADGDYVRGDASMRQDGQAWATLRAGDNTNLHSGLITPQTGLWTYPCRQAQRWRYDPTTGDVKYKTWDATQPEPEAWDLEYVDPSPKDDYTRMRVYAQRNATNTTQAGCRIDSLSVLDPYMACE